MSLAEAPSGVRRFGRERSWPGVVGDLVCDEFHKRRAVGIALPSESSDNSARVTLPHLTNPLVLAQQHSPCVMPKSASRTGKGIWGCIKGRWVEPFCG